MELLVVLAVLAVATSMVLPAIYHSLAGAKVRAKVKELATLLRFARSEAVARKQAHVVMLDLDRETFRLGAVDGTSLQRGLLGDVRAAEEDSGEDQVEDANSGREPWDIRSVQFGKGEALDWGQRPVAFYPRGNSSGGTILITDQEGGHGWQIQVEMLTGRVRLDRARRR